MRISNYIVIVVITMISLRVASAQWVSESYDLKPGWNAIWLTHDVSHESIDDVFAQDLDIVELWRWNPISSASQFTDNPGEVIQSDTRWLIWKRDLPLETTMTHLRANSAYLVHLDDSASAKTLTLKGKAVPPSYAWKSNGENLMGFPTVNPDNTFTRNFQGFLVTGVQAGVTPELYKYDGGDIIENPKSVAAMLFEPVTRGRAYWMNKFDFTDYYGPLKISAPNVGLFYGDRGTAVTMRIQNVTDASVTATLTPLASETAPLGQEAVAGNVPLRIRGDFDPLSGNFAYTDFTSSTDFTLKAGQELEFVFAVDRAAMGGVVGNVFQSLLEITESTDTVRINLPVLAETTSRSGLWVGAASVAQVDQIKASPVPQPDGTATIDITTDSAAATPAEFPVRLILHRDDAGMVKLLQHVIVGLDLNGEQIVTTDESLLDPQNIASARRISSSTFELDENTTANGDVGITGSASFDLEILHDAPTNPFIHTYHPDHDNKAFNNDGIYLPITTSGEESYTVSRSIALDFTNDPGSIGVTDNGWGSVTLGGTYSETISGLRAQDIQVSGSFILYRVSDITTLTE